MIRWALLLMAFSASGVVLFEGGRRVSEPDLLRGYALSRCLAAAYKGLPMELDANRSAEAYREAGHEVRPWVYGELDRLSTHAAAEIPPGLSTGRLCVMRCIELYESGDVRQVSLGRKRAARAAAPKPPTSTVHAPD
jgi:hypothetical protein